MTTRGPGRGWSIALGAAVALAGAVVSGCADDGAGGADTVVEGEGWRGALLDSGEGAMTLPDGTTVDAEPRVPARGDVERFERALPPTEEFTHGPDGPETIALGEGYVRQYTELRGADHRQLKVAGLCEDLTEGGTSSADWTEAWITVQDGGSCYWKASMDLATGKVFSFGFNGMG